MKVVVIDSGLDDLYDRSHIIGGVAVEEKEDHTLYISDNYSDRNGHGTGVIDVILKNTKLVDIFVINIYGNSDKTSEDKLTYALMYAYKNLEFDIIQISSGVLTHSNSLHKIVKKITQSDKVIIAAYDNQGALSYPASFDEVIGIDINNLYSKKEYYDLIYDGLVDVRGAEVFYRMKGLNDKKFISKGRSFLASYFTALVANQNLSKYTKKIVMKSLEKNANNVFRININSIESYKTFFSGVLNAVVFPFNKEIHSIASHESMINFNILDYYDIKHTFNVGRQIKEILGYSNNDKVIKNFDELNWNSEFDALICGHIKEIEDITGRNYTAEIIEKAIHHNKKVFFLDDHSMEKVNKKAIKYISWPSITDKPELIYRFGKLHVPNIPIVAVMGTSSKQGKYTVQLGLIEELKKRGIATGSLATEPTGTILGFNDMFPFGYGTYNMLPPRNMIRILNDSIRQIELDGAEIIISGCQSGTIPYDLRNESLLSVEQYSYLMGINPDGVILCVNDFDDIEYINRTISYLESVITAKVICLVVSHTRSKNSKEIKKHIEKTGNNIEQIKEATNLPIYDLFSLDFQILADKIISFYS